MRQYVVSVLERAHRDLDATVKKLADATTQLKRHQIRQEMNGGLVKIRTAIMHLDEEDLEVFVFFPLDVSIGMYDKQPFLDAVECQKRCDELNRQDGVRDDWRVKSVAVKREWRAGE